MPTWHGSCFFSLHLTLTTKWRWGMKKKIVKKVVKRKAPAKAIKKPVKKVTIKKKAIVRKKPAAKSITAKKTIAVKKVSVKKKAKPLALRKKVHTAHGRKRASMKKKS